jgi:hypothetical protein
MIASLTDEELAIMEAMFYPVAMAECLFSDVDNLTVMTEDKLCHVRDGQIPLLSFEYMIDDNPKLSVKENFLLRKGAGEAYVLGGRNFGKSICVLKLDMCMAFLLLENEKVGFTSYDALHIRGIMEDILNCLEFHPLLSLLEAQTTRSPNYRIAIPKTGLTLSGINMNLDGKNPGKQFFQHHLTHLWADEISFENEVIYNQRRDSVSEIGCIFRFAGMTNFTKHSPCGRLYYDLNKRGFLVNLPQFINPRWDDSAKAQALKDFGGEQSINFRMFCRGEVVEDGVSVMDMERIRSNYDDSRHIKNFEIDKKSYGDYKRLLALDRPSSVEEVYIFADIGETAPTEIGVAFKVGKVYKYFYNITLYNLTDKEQSYIFAYLITLLDSNFIGIDYSDGTGRAILRNLEEQFPGKKLVGVGFNEKIPIGFEKDKFGRLVFKDGMPVYKEEYVTEWSIKHLKDLLE